MREVSIVGIGQTPVGEQWGQSLRALAYEAITQALADAGIEAGETLGALYIGNMIAGAVDSQMQLGAYIADFCGFKGLEAYAIEAACASGGAALRAGISAVASGAHDVVVVCGVEKMTDSLSDAVTGALASAADTEYEVDQGATFVALNALLMQRYQYEYRVPKDAFAPFPINAHHNAAHNPNAMFRFPITPERYASAQVIAPPINILDSSPICDGAAAVVLCASDQARRFGGQPVRITASANATDSLALHDRRDFLWLAAGEQSARRAYAQAGLGPNDIDLFELHDAFSIMATLSLEAAGFAPRGQGWRLALEGEIGTRGRIPISTRGGLKARGHPVGATGIYQVVDAVSQLRGAAGENQVEGARVAMAQNIGGSGATIVTHILQV